MFVGPFHRRQFLCGAGAVAFVGCRSSDVLRFSGIPDGDKRALKARYATVASYLGQRMGREVEYVHVPEYTAAVTSLATGSIDFAWLGGVTTVQAEQRTPAGVHFVAARASDLRFRSYFVAHREFAQGHGLVALPERAPQSLAELAAIAPSLRGRKFSFGAKSSTSGHIMPRAFLTTPEVGLDPDADFDGDPIYQLKGGHAATLRAVASGAVDVGVLNFAVWEAASAELRANAPVVYVTPEYVDYCLVAHARMRTADVQRLRDALVSLDASKAQDGAVLDAFGAERFVPVRAEQWDGIRDVLRTLDADEAAT